MSEKARDIESSQAGYLEVRIRIKPEFEELLSNFIIEEIAFGLITEDLEDETALVCYIPMDSDPEDKLEKIKKYLSLMEILPDREIDDRISSKRIKAIDWITEYQREFQSVEIDDLVIKTPWDESEYPGKKIITIEPKMAFGTGKHETTHLCLQAVKKIIEPCMKVLDLGTGSGILSIYAAMLGATEILGLDIDPEAIPNAIENAQINNVANVFEARLGSMEQVDKKAYYDVVISNLIYDGIVDHFDSFMEALNPGGAMILSGILDNQREDLNRYFEKKISADIEIIRLNEWLCYILRTE